MSDVRITLRGTSPLLCHNVQLADPDNPIVKQQGVINKKRTKTEEDRAELAKLEWYGGLYLAPGIDGPAMPTGNIRKTIINAARITKQGKTIERALFFTDQMVPIAYDGPRDIDALFADSRFHNRAMVRVSMNRVARVRPQFPEWVLVADAYLVDDVLDFEDLVRIVDIAGLAEGLGDNRVNGYGRFTAEVVRV